MRLTTRTNLALRALMFCAVNQERTVRKADIAAACNASENHLAHIVRMLAQNRFVVATRGRRGGLKLARPASDINVGAVFRMFEADLPFAECFSPRNTCPLVEACWLRSAIRNAVDAFYASLDTVSLASLVEGNVALDALLTIRPAGTCAAGIAPQARPVRHRRRK